MNDTQMTLLAFSVGLGLLLGYAVRVSILLGRASRRRRERGTRPTPTASVVTEQKPRSTIKTS